MHKLDKRKVMKRRELKMDRMYKQSSDPFFSLIFLLFSCYFLFLSSKSDHRIVYCWNSRLQSCNSVWISAVRMFSICYSLCCNLLAALQSFQQESPSQYDPICLHLNYYPHQFFGRGGAAALHVSMSAGSTQLKLLQAHRHAHTNTASS